MSVEPLKADDINGFNVYLNGIVKGGIWAVNV